jgi:2-keto-4-pentenoate hydratase/2-oxohepta-3-ene-1,7-dioic acid hydratase in catechol pathway
VSTPVSSGRARSGVGRGYRAARASCTRRRRLGSCAGYTCANDVTARDLQRSDGQWSRAKGFDTFAPLGPWIVTELDPTDLNVVCRVNGRVTQQASTADMVFKIPQLIEYISAAMTLEPGDVILTGTPEGVSPIRPGDEVEVEIAGIGALRNPVESNLKAKM